jgi:hypothetical protein
MTEQEGVIKFRLDFEQRAPRNASELSELNAWRSVLRDTGLIGQDTSRYCGLGYGNLSMRLPPWDVPAEQRSFLVSGTQSSGLPEAGPEHYAVVTRCLPAQNRIRAHGPVRPSSEAMTHGMLYALDPTVRYVFHAHSAEIWRNATKLQVPSTDSAVAYGTPAMADEVRRLFAETSVQETRVFIMGGHEDGVISFGLTAELAGCTMLAALTRARSLSRP